MKNWKSLFKLHRDQEPESIFAHFFYSNGEAPDFPFQEMARKTSDGFNSWQFCQDRFKNKYKGTEVPKLKNYLNYTFKRLLELESALNDSGRYFAYSADGQWVTFNTGLQDVHECDLLMVFQKYKPRSDLPPKIVPDWVYKKCITPTDEDYRRRFGKNVPELAWYSTDSRDFVFDTSYTLDRDGFDHLIVRAKERAGFPSTTVDEVVRNYLKGAIEYLIPKIKRNYKLAIPVYYVEESRMQLLLPFMSVTNSYDACFLVERDDNNKTYRLKTIFDLDKAYFSARLITRPDKDWLNP